jgi:hypothetical protein
MIFQNFGFNAVRGTTPQPPLFIEWLLIGGGASGGTLAQRSGGGGGAGRFVSSSVTIDPQSISITVGAGGAARSSAGVQGANGGDSEMTIGATTYISYGGGGGGAGVNTGTTRNGRPGGSGGGGAGTGTANATTGGSAIDGEPIVGFGNAGESKAVSQDPVSGYGGGAGTGRSGRAWVDGVTYCVGGPGASTGASTGQTAGCGSDGSTNSNSAVGKDGVCIIRYAGSQKATGGTVTSSGGYTYHTFTTSGTFTY